MFFKDHNRLNIDDSFKMQKRNDLKVNYTLQLNDEDTYNNCRIVSKILKIGENNQFGQAMIKPLPKGCIKGKKSIFWMKE